MTPLEREVVRARLDAELSEALSHRGRTVLVTGSAGDGKSSVVNAFLCAHGGVRAAIARCDARRSAHSLGPLVDIAAALGLPKLYAWGSDARASANAFYAAVVAEPTIVVIEDAQHAGPATLDRLVALARRIDRERALLVITFRPEEVGPEHPLRLAIGRLASLHVTRLSLASSADAAPFWEDCGDIEPDMTGALGARRALWLQSA